jgi:hypothetical protein
MKRLLIVWLILSTFTNCKKECPKYIVEGYIINADKNKPIQGAEVTLQNKDCKGFGCDLKFSNTVTDVNGYYKYEFDCKNVYNDYFLGVFGGSTSGLYCKKLAEIPPIGYFIKRNGKSSLREDFTFCSKFNFCIKNKTSNKIYFYYPVIENIGGVSKTINIFDSLTMNENRFYQRNISYKYIDLTFSSKLLKFDESNNKITLDNPKLLRYFPNCPPNIDTIFVNY